MAPGSYGRILQGARKMTAGTFAGQARSATPCGCIEKKVPRGRPIAGEYYIEADPTNQYLSTNVGNQQGVIWDDTTQVGTGLALYEDIISLWYIQALRPLNIQRYTPGPPADTGYVYIYWDVSLPLGSVQMDLITYRYSVVPFTEIQRVTVFNTTSDGGDDKSCFLRIPTPMTVPAGGMVYVGLTLSVATTITYGGEIWLAWAF